MFQGLRSDGTEILPSYAALTIAIKSSKGQVTDRVTLRDTGLFYSGINVQVRGLSVITDSSDSKSAALEKKYSTASGSIFGLSPRFKGEYIRDFLRDAFLRQCKISLRL